MVSETGLPGIAHIYRRERPSLLEILVVRFRINFWHPSTLAQSLGQCTWVLKVSSLRLVIPGDAVSPGLTHSDSRIVFHVNLNVTDTILWQGHHDSHAIELTYFCGNDGVAEHRARLQPSINLHAPVTAFMFSCSGTQCTTQEGWRLG